MLSDLDFEFDLDMLGGQALVGITSLNGTVSEEGSGSIGLDQTG